MSDNKSAGNQPTNDQEVSFFHRLGNAVYLLIFALAALLFLLQYFVSEAALKDLLINLAAGLAGVAFVFFMVNQTLGFDREAERLRKIEGIETGLTLLMNKATESELTIYPAREVIFNISIETLNQHDWQIVRVFAPVGLWNEDEDKTRWLESLAKHASAKQVRQVRAVFGLPPTSKYNLPVSRQELEKNLKHARRILSNFNGLRNVSLNYYPPTHASVGLGAIVFEDENGKGRIAFGLASAENEEVVDRAFGIDNDRIFIYAQSWFDDRIFRKATGSFVLQDDSRTFNEGWNKAIETWYGANYLSVPGIASPSIPS
jgi:hypothetical protein